MKTTVCFLLCCICGMLCTACASSSSKSFDYRGAAILGKGMLRTTTKLVLDNNPRLLPEVLAINAGVATLFSGELTAESLTAQLLVLAPNLPRDDAALFAANLADISDYYGLKSGRKLAVGSPELQALVLALTQGINEGIALHQKGTS